MPHSICHVPLTAFVSEPHLWPSIRGSALGRRPLNRGSGSVAVSTYPRSYANVRSCAIRQPPLRRLLGCGAGARSKATSPHRKNGQKRPAFKSGLPCLLPSCHPPVAPRTWHCNSRGIWSLGDWGAMAPFLPGRPRSKTWRRQAANSPARTPLPSGRLPTLRQVTRNITAT